MNRADIEKLMNGGGEGLPSPQHQGVCDPYTGDVGGSIPSSPATPARNEEGFSADTEILTDSGWKLFADLDRTEAVAAVNRLTDQIEYQHPTAYAATTYNGQMIALRGRRIDALITPRLRMVSCPNGSIWQKTGTTLVKPAEDLKPYHALKSCSKWIGSSDPLNVPPFVGTHGEVIAEGKTVNRGNLAEFMGWYVTSGSSAFTSENRTSRTIISGATGRKADILRPMLQELPWKFGEQTSSGLFYSSQRQLYNFVQECGRGSANKRVPRWVLESSPLILERFFTGCVHGQLFEGEGGHRRIATVSNDLADDLQECLVKMGRGTTCALRQPKERLRRGVIWKVKPQFHVSENRIGHIWLKNGAVEPLISLEHYNGQIYNVAVPSGFIICRRKMKVFIAGAARSGPTR